MDAPLSEGLELAANLEQAIIVGAEELAEWRNESKFRDGRLRGGAETDVIRGEQ